MKKGEEIARVILATLLVMAVWGIYFAICAAPEGATFIYADF